MSAGAGRISKNGSFYEKIRPKLFFSDGVNGTILSFATAPYTSVHDLLFTNIYDENYVLLRAFRAPASLQPFGIRSFCAKIVRKTASSSCLRTQQTASGLRQMFANAHASMAFAAAWLAVFIILVQSKDAKKWVRKWKRVGD